MIQLRDNDLRILGVKIVMDQIVDPILGAIQNVTPPAPPEPASLTALFSSLGQALTRSVGLVLGVAGSIGTGVASFLLMILASIYLSQDAYKIRDLIVNNLPPAYQPEIDSLLFRLRNAWNNFLRGQVVLMVFIGVFVWLGATILGLPGALALGILSGILELLPNLGPILAIIPAIIIALTQGSTHFALSNGVFTLIVIGFYVGSPADRECGGRAQADEQGGQASPAGGDPGVFRGSAVLRHPGCDPGNPGDCLGEGDRQVPVLENQGAPGGSGTSSTAFHPLAHSKTQTTPQEEAPAVEEQPETSKQEQANAKT